MKTFFIQLFIILINVSLLSAQAADSTNISNITDKELVADSLDEEIFIDPELPPSFPGGEAEFRKFIQENLQFPSMQCMPFQKEEFRFVAEFIVNKKGEIFEPKIVRTNGDHQMEQAILKMIKSMPNWTPGYFNGELKDTEYKLPLLITYSDKK